MAAATPKSTIIMRTSASPARIQKALRLLDSFEKAGDPERVKKALHLFSVLEKYFKSGGRFRKPRKKKSVKPASTS